MRLITLIRLIKLIIKRNDKSNKDEDDDESSDSDDDDAELQTRRCKLLAGWPLDLCPGPGLDLLLTKGKKKQLPLPARARSRRSKISFTVVSLPSFYIVYITPGLNSRTPFQSRRLFAIFLYRIYHP